MEISEEVILYTCSDIVTRSGSRLNLVLWAKGADLPALESWLLEDAFIIYLSKILALGVKGLYLIALSFLLLRKIIISCENNFFLKIFYLKTNLFKSKKGPPKLTQGT